MSIKVAQAASSEYYTAWGKPGRQRPDELNIIAWSQNESNPWHHVFRPKNLKVAEAIATFFEGAVANYAIGYSQNNADSPRTTLYDYAKEQNWDVTKVTKACNTDCSALAGAACAAAGISSAKLRDMYTGSMVSVLTATGAFDIFTDDAHCKSESELMRGDLLLRNGHTCCVLNNAQFVATGEYCTTHDCASLNLRKGPSTAFDIVTTVAGNSVLPYIRTDSETKWIKCRVGNHEGFLSNKYCYKLSDAITTGNVYIRANAGKGKIVGAIPNGEHVALFKETSKVSGRTWFRVYYNGTIGWSSSLYVKAL